MGQLHGDIPDEIRQELLEYPNVTGVAYGLKETDEEGLTDEESVVVFVEQKLPETELGSDEVIPQSVEIDGQSIRTDVRSSGIITFEEHPMSVGRQAPRETEAEERTPKDRIRPAPGGVSCGHVSLRGAGTLGTSPLRTEDGDLVCLTNSHVAGLNGKAARGDEILQPGVRDGGRSPQDILGQLYEASTTSTDEPNTTDSALVEVSRNRIEDSLFCFETELRGWTKPRLGREYAKCGRTSGLTEGLYIARDGEFNVRQSDGDTARFTGIDVYTSMTNPGDSGSLYVDVRDDGLYGTSLHFAGGGGVSLGIPMEAVQSEHGDLTPLSAEDRKLAPGETWEEPVFKSLAGPQWPLPGDSRDTDGSFTEHRFVNDEGEELQYRKYVPSKYEEAQADVPLLVMLHGCTQDPESFAAETKTRDLAEPNNCIVLYPDQSGLPQHLQECWTWWEDAHTMRGNGEASLIAGMTRQESAEHDIDSEQVFVAGFSAGAAMVSNLVVAYPDLFTAACIHSGLEYDAAENRIDALHAMREGGPPPLPKGSQAYQDMQDNARVVPIVIFHGTNDRIVDPINADQVLKQFAQTNDFADNGRDDDSIHHEPDDVISGQASNRRYKREEYHNEDGELVITRYLVEGMGHAWSGGAQGGQYTDPNGPDATRLMWDFFESKQLGKKPVADASTIVTKPGEPVTFYGGGSYDADGEITSYEWHFEDGKTKRGDTVTNSFHDPGEYTVTLEITDDEGHVDTDTRTVRIESQ